MSKSLQRTENEILGQIIRDLTDEGYAIKTESVGAETFVLAYDGVDMSGEAKGFVKFVWGNGADCLSDYSIPFEKCLSPSLELQKFLAD